MTSYDPRNFGVVVARALSELRTRFRTPPDPLQKQFLFGFVLCTKKDNEESGCLAVNTHGTKVSE